MNDDAKLVSNFVQKRIRELAAGSSESISKALLANLRRGIGRAPGSIPELWGIMLDGLPEALLSKGNEPSRGEWAVHTSLTLYALHQQGKDPKKQCMSKDGSSLGAAVRRLIKSDEDEARIKRRFDAAATADSLGEFSHHLRGLVQLLKAEDIPLDYPEMAKDLYWFQFPEARDRVRLRWGQDFYRNSKEERADNAGKEGKENGKQ